MNEEWKDVPSFEGIFQVSNLGRIKSFRRLNFGQIMSTVNKNGDYLRYRFISENKTVTLLIHRLVYSVFVGAIPEGNHVDHINGNKQDNVVTNLQCLSPKKHSQKSIKQNHRVIAGMNFYNIYRSREIDQCSLNGTLIMKFPTIKVASEVTGVCKRNIAQVASKSEYKPGRTRKQAGGFIWRYSKEDII